MLRKIRPLKRLIKLLFMNAFCNPQDYWNYYKLAIGASSLYKNSPVYLRPRNLKGHAVLCRPGTTDIGSLDDLLFYNYYLPSYSCESPQIILDLGANVGYTTIHFAYLYPTARIIGVELDINNFAILKENIKGLEDRIFIINAAVWYKSTIVSYQGNAEDAFQVEENLLPPKDHGLSVKSMTINQLMSEYSFDRIDFLKMDIEGAEKEILLTHTPNWLSHVKHIKLEYHDKSYYAPLLQVLKKFGFFCSKDTKHWSSIEAIKR